MCRSELVYILIFTVAFTSLVFELANPLTRIFVTKQLYNGTIGYNGLLQACNKERQGSKPCNHNNLILVNFWNHNIIPSWILSLAMNCVGYSTDDVNTVGLCVQTQYGKQVIPCSCNMNIPICCFNY